MIRVPCAKLLQVRLASYRTLLYRLVVEISSLDLPDQSYILIIIVIIYYYIYSGSLEDQFSCDRSGSCPGVRLPVGVFWVSQSPGNRGIVI